MLQPLHFTTCKLWAQSLSDCLKQLVTNLVSYINQQQAGNTFEPEGCKLLVVI